MGVGASSKPRGRDDGTSFQELQDCRSPLRSSYSFTRYPYSGNPAELENVSDLDAIALKMAIALLGKGGMALVHLEQYLADVANMVGL